MKRLLVFVFAVALLGSCEYKEKKTPESIADDTLINFLYDYDFNFDSYEDSVGHNVSEIQTEEALQLVETYGYNSENGLIDGHSVNTIAIKLQDFLKDKYYIEFKSLSPYEIPEEGFEIWKKKRIKEDSLRNDKSYMDSINKARKEYADYLAEYEKNKQRDDSIKKLQEERQNMYKESVSCKCMKALSGVDYGEEYTKMRSECRTMFICFDNAQIDCMMGTSRVWYECSGNR